VGVLGSGMQLVGDAFADGARSSPRAGGPSIERALDAARPAKRPFRGMTATHVKVGRSRLAVVVADDFQERVQGLRRRADLGRYDGMLFVFDSPTSTSFTMSTVPVPLDLGLYDEDGRVVDRLRMRPCSRSEAQCPSYRPSGGFSYSLETLTGDLPTGRLSGG
jgi:uncharacterized membrane protein (UPF0127 family)